MNINIKSIRAVREEFSRLEEEAVSTLVREFCPRDSALDREETERAVRQILKWRLGEPRPRGAQKITDEQAWDMGYEKGAGVSNLALAAKYGVTPLAVHLRLKEYGLTRRNCGTIEA